MSIRLKKTKEKVVLNFHPWIFSGAIEEVTESPKSGDTVRVISFAGDFLAYGHYDPGSQIRVRLFSFDEQLSDLDTGFWTRRWTEVFKRKSSLIDPKKTSAFRFLFSEGDMSPGFIVDCFGDAAVILFRSAGSRRFKQELIEFLSNEGYNTILEKGDKTETDQSTSTQWLKGEKTIVDFLENGHRFVADILNGQKTGFFLDQRENRNLVGSYSKGKTVLNSFGYSGAFSVYALKNGAKMVHTLDISDTAIALCEKNLKINFTLDEIQDKHKSLVLDSFNYLKEMETGFYDLIILDPPAFTKHISKIQQAARGYKDINMKAISKIKSGGLIFTFSCSQHISTDLFRKIIYGAAKDTGRQVKVLHQLSQAWDHGFSIYHPEGEYLKGLVIQVD